MSVQKIKIGTTIGEAFSFAFGRFFGVLMVGWFPMTLGLAAFMGLGMYFFGPALAVYGDMISVMFLEGGMMDPTIITPEQNAAWTKGFEEAFKEIGVANAIIGGCLILVVVTLLYTVPMVAYSRMFVLGGPVRSPIYFKLGSREVKFVITYLVIFLISMGAILGFGLGGGLLIGILATINEGLATVGGIVLGVGMFAIYLWVIGRLMLALPAAAVEGGIPISRAWRLSAGNGWRIVWALILGGLVLSLAMFPLSMLMQIFMSILVNPLLAAGNTKQALIVGGGVGGILVVVYYCFTMSFQMALLSSPYKHLTQSSEEPAE